MLERVELDQCDLESVELGADDDSPLAGLEPTGDVEEDCKRELAVVKTSFQERKATEEARRKKATDSEYWVCLCFQTREQVEEFMRNCEHPRPDEKYVDGVKFARRIGKGVTIDATPYGQAKIDPKWSKLAMEE